MGRKKFLIVIAVVIVLCIYLSLRRHDDLPKQLGDPVEAYQSLIKENSENIDNTIQIFAKVVDGDTNKPLKGALIEVNYQHFSPTPPTFFTTSTIKAVSDENGLFFIDKIKCRKFYLNNISLDNYWEKGQRNTFPNYNFIKYKGNKENPAIFKLHKEVNDNFIFNSDSRPLQVIEDEKCVSFFGILEHFNVEREVEKYDFLCTAELKDNKTTINLKGFDSSCSFYLNDKELLIQEDLLKFKNALIVEEIKDIMIQQIEEKQRFFFIKFGNLHLYVRVKLNIQLNSHDSFIN